MHPKLLEFYKEFEFCSLLHLSKDLYDTKRKKRNLLILYTYIYNTLFFVISYFVEFTAALNV